MTYPATITILDAVYAQVSNVHPDHMSELSRAFRFRKPGWNYMLGARKRGWDGWTNFFSAKTGKFLTGLIPEMQSALEQLGYEVSIGRSSAAPKPLNIDESLIDENLIITNKGTKQYPMRDYQVSAVWKMVEHERGIVVLPTGCHAKGQGVMMFDGSIRKVETIKVGDYLMGADGNPRRVLALCRGRGRMCKILPVKGQPFIVNEDHILTLVRTSDKSKHVNEVTDVSVCEWFSWAKSKKHVHKLFRTGVLNFGGKHHALPIDPYFLGILLGDGAFQDSISVTTADVVIRDCVYTIAQSFGLNIRKGQQEGNASTSYFLTGVRKKYRNPLLNKVRELGLMHVGASSKFIPYQYKTASIDERVALLSGLLDADGHLTCNGYDIVSKSRNLAEDCAFVARSLGLAAYVKPCKKKCYNNGKIGNYWRVSISGNCDILKCRLSRRQASPRRQKKSVLRTGFKVERLGIDAYYGFSLDGDGRFLLDDFTVTHNTGKTTVMGGYLKLQGDRPALVLFRSVDLLHQTHEEFLKMGVPEHLLGICYAKVWRPARIVMTTAQSLHHVREVLPAIRSLIADECHHGIVTNAVVPYLRLMKKCQNRYAISATPWKKDDKVHNYKLKGHFGPQLTKMRTGEAQERGILSGAVIQFVKFDSPDGFDFRCEYIDGYRGVVVENDEFHDMVANIVSGMKGRTLILVEWKDHGVALQQRIPGSYWVCGDDKKDVRHDLREKLRSDKHAVVISTRIFGTGLDFYLHNLVNCGGGAIDIGTIQRLGRGLRLSDDKERLIYVDFVPLAHEDMKRHGQERIRTLRKEGHDVIIMDDPSGLCLS